jgi:beta-lactamase class A
MIERELADVFEQVGATGFVHGTDLERGIDVGFQPDHPVVLASVFKIPVLLELGCRAATGEVDLDERVRVEPADRVMGPTGISAFRDAVEISLHDLAVSMMSVSDNTATDLLMARLGWDRIQARVDELGLSRTRVDGDCRFIFSSIVEDIGVTSAREFADATPEQIGRWRSLDPERTNRSTPRDVTALLEMIWFDKAGPPEACAFVRQVMAQQIWPHRLRTGFPDGVAIAAKTGTLPGIRNEAGVVTYPDGARYAVAVFTREASLQSVRPAVDASIGTAARLAIEHLRRGDASP